MITKKEYISKSKKYPYTRGKCACGRITTKQIDGTYICSYCLGMKSLDSELTEGDKRIFEAIKKTGLTPEEILTLSKGVPNEPIHFQPYNCRQSKVKIGVISDTHIGSKFYDDKLMDRAAKVFSKNKVDFVLHAGDILEGHYENKRQGSVFELSEVGGDNQVKRAVKELSKIKQPIYAITGNHEYNTFYKMCGFEIGEQLQDKLPNFHYLGNARGIIKLPYNQKIELIHPDGGSSYAISYKPQKIIEAMEGGTKPILAIIGHFHKKEHLEHRGVEIIQAGTLQSQSTFMRNNSLAAHKGFWILDVESGKNGLSKLGAEWYKAY
jgi:predicted phosphodiesterase